MPTTVAVGVPNASMVVGSTQTATATVSVTESDNTLNQRAIAWSSSNTAVLTVAATTATCVVTAVGPGTAQVRALVDGVTGAATVTVTPPPVPLIAITAAQEASIMAVPVGGKFTLQGPTKNIDCQVTG